MKILLLSDSKVDKRRFIEALRVNGNPLFSSMNSGIAIKREILIRLEILQFMIQ